MGITPHTPHSNRTCPIKAYGLTLYFNYKYCTNRLSCPRSNSLYSYKVCPFPPLWLAVSLVLWALGLPITLLISSLIPLIVHHTSFEEVIGPQLFCIVYLSSTSPSSQTGGCLCTLAIAVTEMLSAVNINTSTLSNLIIISQDFSPVLNSLHSRFGSVAPCPTLKSDVTASTPRTRYGRLARPYPTGFSCYIQSAYKSKQSFLAH